MKIQSMKLAQIVYSIYNPKKKQAELKGSCGHEL